jgi:filamentous hemagglutinin family protein
VEALIMSAYRSAPVRARLLAGCAIAAAATATQADAQRAFQAIPTDVIGATVNQNTGLDVVTVNSTQALIDWTPTDNAGTGTINILAQGDELRFRADNASSLPRYTVLNRINPADPSRPVRIDGIVNSLVETGYGISDGSIWFYTPGGIILGPNARFDVGSLVLTTNAPQVGNFDTEGLFVGQDPSAVAGTIAFRGTADSKSFVTVEAGAKINAAGSYVALVAPRVAQRGAITVNGSAALISAESADVTIPVSGNLFEIAVFSGSKVDASGETIFEHTGSTEIADPAQSFASRRIYMVAVPKNDAITMLVSGKAGYEAASAVTAVAGRVYLQAAADLKIVGDNPLGGPGPSTSIVISDATANTDVFAGGTFLSVDATAAPSSFGGALSLNSGAGSAITVANGFSVDVGLSLGGSATLGVAPSTVTVSSGGTLSVANDLSLFSFIGTGTGSDMSVTVDNGTLVAGGSLGIRSTAGSIGGPISGSTGGATSLAIRNNGVVSVDGSVTLESRGIGIGSSGTAAPGTGGASTLLVESGGQLLTGSIIVESLGRGGDGTVGGVGQAGLASLKVDGGIVEVGYGVTVRSIGQGGGSSAMDGAGGAGLGGTASVSVLNTGKLEAGTFLSILATGEGGFESGYGAIVGGSGTGGTLAFSTESGGIVTSPLISLDVSGQGRDGQAGGGAGKAGALTLQAKSAELTFDQLTVNARGQGGSNLGGTGGSGTGGDVTVALDTSSFAGANVLQIDAGASGGEGGGSGKGGRIGFSATGSELITTGNIDLFANGFGDFGTDSGGSGSGGKIEVVADSATLAAGNINLDASGFGQAAFSTGLAGDGEGGVIGVTSTNGSLVKGLSFVTANGRSGDGLGEAVAGAAIGGTVKVRATGGTIDSTGGTLRVFAEGVGGYAETGAAA